MKVEEQTSLEVPYDTMANIIYAVFFDLHAAQLSSCINTTLG
jgi:hypothetical protein